MANKVKYGLKSLYYAPITVAESGAESFGTPVAIPGAVSITLSPVGEKSEFYADNILYWSEANNQGYEGSFEVALLPESFKTAILGMRTDNQGKVVESLDNKQARFALLWQFEGDESATRYVFYNCTAERPEIAGNTTEASKTPNTETVSFTATGDANGHVRAYSAPGGADYADWFGAVPQVGTFPA